MNTCNRWLYFCNFAQYVYIHLNKSNVLAKDINGQLLHLYTHAMGLGISGQRLSRMVN